MKPIEFKPIEATGGNASDEDEFGPLINMISDDVLDGFLDDDEQGVETAGQGTLLDEYLNTEVTEESPKIMQAREKCEEKSFKGFDYTFKTLRKSLTLADTRMGDIVSKITNTTNGMDAAVREMKTKRDTIAAQIQKENNTIIEEVAKIKTQIADAIAE